MAAVTLTVCAGGKSSRMGTDKAFVELAGKPLITHVLERLRTLEQQNLILIANQRQAYGSLSLPVYSDVLPERGSLGGIYTALYYSSTLYTLVVGCDMPFLNIELLGHMIDSCDEQYDAIVPCVGGLYQGLHAIYSRSCLHTIHQRLTMGELKVASLFEELRLYTVSEQTCRRYDPHGLSFFNVNTPQELLQAQELLASFR